MFNCPASTRWLISFADTYMVSFSCEWLYAWSVSVVSGCMHGQFQLWVVVAWSVSFVSGCLHGQFQL